MSAVQDPARNLLTAKQERRLERLEAEDPDARVVGYRRPAANKAVRDEVGIEPIVRRLDMGREILQAVCVGGNLRRVAA